LTAAAPRGPDGPGRPGPGGPAADASWPFGLPGILDFGPVRPFAQAGGIDPGGDWRGRLMMLPTDSLSAWPMSAGRSPEPLAESIGRLGLARPLWVARAESGGPVVIAGGQRLQALRLLGQGYAPCLAPPGPFLAAMALTDNLDRGLNQAELALAWRLARQAAPGEERALVIRLAGLVPRDRRISALVAAESNGRILAALAEAVIDLENARFLADLSGPEIDMVLGLFRSARPSRSSRRIWLEILSDLRRIRDLSLDRLFSAGSDREPATPEAAALAEALAAGQGAEKRVGALLERLRRPGIARLRERRQSILKSLKLPEGLSITVDPELEDAAPEIRLTLGRASDLGALARAALDLAERPELAELFLEDRLSPEGPDGWRTAGGREDGTDGPDNTDRPDRADGTGGTGGTDHDPDG
jgi:hypothetical protein